MADSKSKSVVSVVLSKEALEQRAASDEGLTFAGFPGVYRADEPVSLAAIELDEKEARQKIKDLNLPLELSTESAPVEDPPAIWELVDETELEPGEAVPIHAMHRVESGAELPFEVESVGHGMNPKDRRKMVDTFLKASKGDDMAKAEAAANVLAEHGGEVF